MSHLVGDHQGHFFLGANRSGFGIDQQVGFAIGYGAEILHGAGLEVRQGDQVELLERIGNAEVIVVIVEHVFGDIDAVGGERNLVRRGADADGHAILLAGRALEVAHQKSNKVRGHLGRGGEFERVLAGGGAGRIG